MDKTKNSKERRDRAMAEAWGKCKGDPDAVAKHANGGGVTQHNGKPWDAEAAMRWLGRYLGERTRDEALDLAEWKAVQADAYARMEASRARKVEEDQAMVKKMIEDHKKAEAEAQAQEEHIRKKPEFYRKVDDLQRQRAVAAEQDLSLSCNKEEQLHPPPRDDMKTIQEVLGLKPIIVGVATAGLLGDEGTNEFTTEENSQNLVNEDDPLTPDTDEIFARDLRQSGRLELLIQALEAHMAGPTHAKMGELRCPIPSGPRKNTGICVNEEILAKALEKAKAEGIGSLSRLTERLLWQYVNQHGHAPQ
ncbi:MAG: hypothetical protein V2B18_25185 [Pseudomonadota bacterium]